MSVPANTPAPQAPAEQKPAADAPAAAKTDDTTKAELAAANKKIADLSAKAAEADKVKAEFGAFKASVESPEFLKTVLAKALGVTDKKADPVAELEALKSNHAALAGQVDGWKSKAETNALKLTAVQKLVQANVLPNRVVRALNNLDLPAVADDAAITASVEKMTAELPEWFGRPAAAAEQKPAEAAKPAGPGPFSDPRNGLPLPTKQPPVPGVNGTPPAINVTPENVVGFTFGKGPNAIPIAQTRAVLGR